MRLQVTQSPACRLAVTLLNATTSGGTKFKVRAAGAGSLWDRMSAAHASE